MDPEAHREEEAALATEVAVEAVVEVQGEEPSAQLVEDLEEVIPTSPGQEVAFEDVDHNFNRKALRRLWSRSSHITHRRDQGRYWMGSELSDIDKLSGLLRMFILQQQENPNHGGLARAVA